MEQDTVDGMQNENKESENVKVITSPKQAVKRKACSEVDVNVVEDRPLSNEPLAKRTKLRSDRSVQPGTAFTGAVLWAVDVIADGKGLFVNDEAIYIGTRDGRVVKLSHEGELIKQHKLNGEVSMITQWNDRILAWCHARNGLTQWKGALYDVTEQSPRMLMDILEFGNHVIHAAVVDGCLALGDNEGSLVLLGCDANMLWEHKQNVGSGGMFESDESGIYFGHKRKLCKYNVSDGSIAWSCGLGDGRQQIIQSGCLHGESVYMEVDGRVIELNKLDGSIVKEFQPDRHMAENVVVNEHILFTGSCPTVLFDPNDGTEKFRMNFTARLRDAALKIRDDGKLLVYWDKLYCIDTTHDGIQRAIDGKSRRTDEKCYDFDDKMEEEHTSESEEDVDEEQDSVLVYCAEEKGQLVVHSCGATFNKDYPVLLPPLLRQTGATYRVGSLLQSKTGQFYLVSGDIVKITDPAEIGSTNQDECQITNISEEEPPKTNQDECQTADISDEEPPKKKKVPTATLR